MKLHRGILAVVACVCLLMASTASANSWGLRGGLLPLFEHEADYVDYTMGAADEDTEKGRPSVSAFFIMSSRYHNELNVAYEGYDGAWHIELKSTTAVYQPGEEPSPCTIRWGEMVNASSDPDGDSFPSMVVSYAGESYTMVYRGGAWLWEFATFAAGDGTVRVAYDWEQGGYVYSDGAEQVLWQMGYIALADFNIARTPRTLAQVKRMNQTLSILHNDELYDWVGLNPNEKRTIPVYAAPSASSYRGAKGKAAVSLNDDLVVLGQSAGEWDLISYAISPRRSRVGWVAAAELGDVACAQLVFPRLEAAISGEADAAECFLTDDPWVSQSPLRTFAAGERVNCLATYGVWAYVETEVSGKAAFGFVPLAALETDAEMIVAATKAKLAGTWSLYAGGNMFGGDVVELSEDGTYRMYERDIDASDGLEDGKVSSGTLTPCGTGEWSLALYDRAQGLYWDDPTFEITFVPAPGEGYARGLHFSSDSGLPAGAYMGLSNDEGSGGYVQVTVVE